MPETVIAGAVCALPATLHDLDVLVTGLDLLEGTRPLSPAERDLRRRMLLARNRLVADVTR